VEAPPTAESGALGAVDKDAMDEHEAETMATQ
jgi:hypothetical protein